MYRKSVTPSVIGTQDFLGVSPGRVKRPESWEALRKGKSESVLTAFSHVHIDAVVAGFRLFGF